MESQDKLIKSILNRNNYSFDLDEQGGVTIQQTKANSSIMNVSFYTSIFISIVGLLLLTNGSVFGGVTLLAGSLGMLLRVSSQKEEQERNFGQQIKFSNQSLSIKKDNIITKINFNDITNIHFDFDETRTDLFSGLIEVKGIDEEYHKLIEIYGSDARYVEDDINLLVHFIADKINAE